MKQCLEGHPHEKNEQKHKKYICTHRQIHTHTTKPQIMKSREPFHRRVVLQIFRPWREPYTHCSKVPGKPRKMKSKQTASFPRQKSLCATILGPIKHHLGSLRKTHISNRSMGLWRALITWGLRLTVQRDEGKYFKYGLRRPSLLTKEPSWIQYASTQTL